MTFEARTEERMGLSDPERNEVQHLMAQCRPVDVHIAMDAGARQFLSYHAGTLLGVLGLARDGEACLCVAPDARRRGIGRALLGAADARLAREGIAAMLVECDASSSEGHAFLRAMGGRICQAEFRLRLADTSALRAPLGKVQLRRAGREDLASLARTAALSFGSTEEQKLAEFTEQLATGSHQLYVARVHGEDVGGIRMAFYGDETHLTEIHVAPEARRGGYGRDLLVQACAALIDDGRKEIILEVLTDNEAALRLYRSCGFELVRRYDFYKRPVQ